MNNSNQHASPNFSNAVKNLSNSNFTNLKYNQHYHHPNNSLSPTNLINSGYSGGSHRKRDSEGSQPLSTKNV